MGLETRSFLLNEKEVKIPSKGDLVFFDQDLTTLIFAKGDEKSKHLQPVGKVIHGLDVIDTLGYAEKILHCGLIIRK